MARIDKTAVENTEISIEFIKIIIETQEIGEEKKGDLSGVFVYKFDCVNQQYLLAYEWDDASRALLLLGVHENSYRSLKQ